MKQKITYISSRMSIVNDGIFCARHKINPCLHSHTHLTIRAFNCIHTNYALGFIALTDIAKSDWKRMLWIYWMIWHSQINQMDSPRIQQTVSNRSKLENCEMIDRKMCLVLYTIQCIQSRTKSTKTTKKQFFLWLTKTSGLDNTSECHVCVIM